jgi:4-amino-4-deoxy-L-arabinose transferase-like glycosyltransferase
MGIGEYIKRNWKFMLLFCLVFALGFLIRVARLTTFPIFADEAIYIRWAQVMHAEETLRFLPLSDGKEPLFMWVIIPFLKLIHDPLFAGRFVSVLSGLGTMIGVSYLSFLLTKNKKVALAAAFIYSLSPFVFFFDRMSLVDSMLSMFGIWTFIFSLLAFRHQRLDFAMIAGFFLGGAWLTKSPALFFAIMLPTLWLFIEWKKGLRRNLLIFLKTLSLSVVTVVIGYGFYNILRLGPNFHLIASRNLDYVYPINHLLVNPLDPLKTHLVQVWQWLVTMGPWSLLVLALVSWALCFRKYWRQLLVLSVWFLGPILVQAEFAKVFTARYILFSIPYLIIISAFAFSLELRYAKWLSVVILGFFAAQAILFDRNLLVAPEKANLPRSERSGYLEEWTAGQGIAQIADYLEKEQSASPEEKIVVGTEGYFGTLPDGLQIYLNDRPEIIVIGTGLVFGKLPSSLRDSKMAGNKTYLVVNASRFHNTAENLGLKLIEEFPKAQKPDGTRDALLFFEVVRSI